MNGLGRRSLALKLRKETTLSHVKIAEKVNASPQTVSRWLRGIPAGSDVRQGGVRRGEVVKTRLSTRFKPSHLTSPHTSPHLGEPAGKVKKRGVSDEVKKTLDEATEIVKPTIKKVKAKKKKPEYIPATIERIDPEPEPEIKEETQETLDLEPKEKKSSGFMVWVFLAVILFIAGYYFIKWLSERSEQIPGLAEQEQKPITPTNPNGLGGEIDFTQGGKYDDI